MLEVLKAIEKIMGNEVKIKFVDDKSGHDRRYTLATKLKYEVTPLKKGVEEDRGVVLCQQVGALGF